MALPEGEKKRADELLIRLCAQRTARYGSEKVLLKHVFSGNRVTLIESRPFFVDPNIWNDIKVAQFEYNPDTATWTLYWYDRRNRRQPYPTGRNRDLLDRLVGEVASDPTGIFWE